MNHLDNKDAKLTTYLEIRQRNFNQLHLEYQKTKPDLDFEKWLITKYSKDCKDYCISFSNWLRLNTTYSEEEINKLINSKEAA